MEQTVYIDIFFLINFSMDLLCFFITSRLISHRLALGRAVISSMLGATYACISLMLTVGGLWGLLADILVCLIMSVVAVKKKGGWGDTLSYSVVYTAVSVVLGGIMTALFSLMNRMDVPKVFGGEDINDNASVWLFAFFAVLSGVATLFGGRAWKKRSSREKGRVEISYGESKVIMKAICDSGNLLTEPISGRKCIIADRKRMEAILPEGIGQMMKNGSVDRIRPSDMARVRVVPTHTVNGKGMLYAIHPDEIRLNMGKGWRKVEAYVALSELADNGEWVEALVPAELVADAP